MEGSGVRLYPVYGTGENHVCRVVQSDCTILWYWYTPCMEGSGVRLYPVYGTGTHPVWRVVESDCTLFTVLVQTLYGG